ncbi:unnamed protein product [Closterium sp. NIES-54]
MALRPSSVPLRVSLLSPLASSLADGADREPDLVRASSPTVPLLLATVVTDPSFESTAASALVAELVDFATSCRLDYAASLVAESKSDCPPSVGGECALGTDVLEDKHEDFECLAAAVPHLVAMLLAPEGDPDALDIPTPLSYAEAITGPYSSPWQTAMDAEMALWNSIGTYADAVPLPAANIVDGMWIFRVKRLPGSPPVFKARYVARGFSQRQGVDFFQTFFPTPKMTTLRVLLHVAAQCDYELHSLEFSTTFLEGSLHEEIWLRHPPGFTRSFPAGTQWSLRQLVYGLRQAPREWHDTLRTTLAALGFAPWTADPSLFLCTDTSLPPFYILVYVDDLVFTTAYTEALALVKSELQKRHTCTDLGELRSYLGLQITRDKARRTITLTQSHMVHQVLQRFGFRYSSPQSIPLSTGHSLSAPPLDESVEPSGPYPELVGYLIVCGDFVIRPEIALVFLDWSSMAKNTRKVGTSTAAIGASCDGDGGDEEHGDNGEDDWPENGHDDSASGDEIAPADIDEDEWWDRPVGSDDEVEEWRATPGGSCVKGFTFDHEGHPIQFDTWLDDLQLYLLSDSRVSISLFDHTSGASLAPPATADSATRSQWLNRDAAAPLAICTHLWLAECAHFGQHKTALALYDAVVAHYSSPATAALGRLILPYLFPELSAFATVEDLPGGAEPEGAEPGGTEPEVAEPVGAESEGAESEGAEPRGTASARGPAGASPRVLHRQEPLSPQQLREWFAQRTCVRSGVAGAGGTGAGGVGAGGTGAGGAGASTSRGIGVAGAAGLGGARTGGTGAAGAGGVGGAGAGDPRARGTRAGNPGAGGAGAGDAGAGDPGARGTGTGGVGAGGTGAGGAGAGGTGGGDPRAGGAGAGGTGVGGTGAGGTTDAS